MGPKPFGKRRKFKPRGKALNDKLKQDVLCSYCGNLLDGCPEHFHYKDYKLFLDDFDKCNECYPRHCKKCHCTNCFGSETESDIPLSATSTEGYEESDRSFSLDVDKDLVDLGNNQCGSRNEDDDRNDTSSGESSCDQNDTGSRDSSFDQNDTSYGDSSCDQNDSSFSNSSDDDGDDPNDQSSSSSCDDNPNYSNDPDYQPNSTFTDTDTDHGYEPNINANFNEFRIMNLEKIREHISEITLHAATCSSAIELAAKNEAPIQLLGEVQQQGMASFLHSKCNGCGKTFSFCTSPKVKTPEGDRFEINVRAVWAQMSTGGGSAKLNEQTATMGMPGLQSGTYSKIEKQIGLWWKKVLQEEMINAGQLTEKGRLFKKTSGAI